ncbi:hypothetical protein HDU76_008336 [Blyttiomyces sp. JEL0837]|nr:hypothetical protein HDU76_008336 [Blyttiomyces sp. JEL0837]
MVDLNHQTRTVGANAPTTETNIYSVKVVHADQRIRIDVDSTWTLKRFKNEIAEEMALDSSTVTVFYKDSDAYKVKLKGDHSFQAALKETELFVIVQEGPVVGVSENATAVGSMPEEGRSDGYVIKATYETIHETKDYAIEIQSPSFDEFKTKVRHVSFVNGDHATKEPVIIFTLLLKLFLQFAWNQTELESMLLLHETTVVTGSAYFGRILQSQNVEKDSKVDAASRLQYRISLHLLHTSSTCLDG